MRKAMLFRPLGNQARYALIPIAQPKHIHWRLELEVVIQLLPS